MPPRSDLDRNVSCAGCKGEFTDVKFEQELIRSKSGNRMYCEVCDGSIVAGDDYSIIYTEV